MRLRATRPSGRRDAGFNLVELMVVVVILGIAASVSWPLLTRDSQQASGEQFARSVMREMQRARSQAISETLRVRVHFFSDRIEVRSWVRGATTGPDTTLPALRVISAPYKTIVANVLEQKTGSPPTSASLSGTPMIDFNTNGSSTFVGSIAAIPSSTIWILNTALNNASDRWRFKIDVNAVTGFSRLFSGLAANDP